MKKRAHSISEHFPSVELYRDDIEKLTSLLKENGFSEIQFETASWIYDPSEFQLIEEWDIFESIKAKNNIEISINFETSAMTASDDSVIGIGLIKKIGILLNTRRKISINFLKSNWLNGLIWAFYPISSATIWSYTNSLKYTALYIITYIGIYIVIATAFYPKNIIHLRKKKDFPNFWQRNKDQLILLPLGAILGALATLFIVWK